MNPSVSQKKVRITFASSFPKAVHAIFEGELCRITHAGDAEGMSPCYNVVDSQGQSAWVPQSQVRIVDQDYLPITQEALGALTEQARKTSAAIGAR